MKSQQKTRIRGDAEHVVLADCVDANGIQSSQAAYFSGSPGPHPDDTAVTSTPYNQTARWENATTATRFPATGVTFTATLFPVVEQGQWAGTGDNGYASFVCWQEYSAGLYNSSGAVCSGVYDCDHEPTPTSTPTPISTSSSSGSRSGLDRGIMIAIIVSIVAFVLMLTFAGLLIFTRYRSRKNGHQGGCIFNIFSRSKRPPAEGVDPPSEPGKKYEYPGSQPGQVYEMPGQWQGPEMGGDQEFPPREMDGACLPGEMAAEVGTPVEGVDRGRSRWRLWEAKNDPV